MRWVGNIAHMGMNCGQVFLGKSEGKSPLGTPVHRLGDNIKMDLEYGERVKSKLIWLRTGTGVHCNESSHLVKGEESDLLSDCQFLSSSYGPTGQS